MGHRGSARKRSDLNFRYGTVQTLFITDYRESRITAYKGLKNTSTTTYMAFSKIFLKFNHTMYLVIFLKCNSDRSSVVKMLTIFKAFESLNSRFENMYNLYIFLTFKIFALSITVVFVSALIWRKIVIIIHNEKWNRTLSKTPPRWFFVCLVAKIFKCLNLYEKKTFKTMTT